jgi:phosphoglycolate phosphatase-like HAD superfamily hydrolase
MFILLDIDHTISNSFWRDPMIGAENWDKYHEASKYDKPFKKVVNLINSLAAMGYSIIAVTGRNEKFRHLTLDWFIKYHIDVDEMLMRPDDNFLKNAEMKALLIDTRFNGDYKQIHFAIEDNEDACIMYQRLGITSLQIRNISGGENATKHDNK